MSFSAMLWVFEHKLPPVQKLVLLAIASHANNVTGRCFPKVQTIADKASITRRSVHRNLRMLEKTDLLQIERKFRGRGRQPSDYVLNMPLIQKRKPPGDSGVSGPGDSSVTDKRNHYRNHNNRARQEAESTLAEMLGPDGWEILIAFPEMVPLLVGKLARGTLSQRDLTDLRARFTLKGGKQ
jgi:hypothetical protein